RRLPRTRSYAALLLCALLPFGSAMAGDGWGGSLAALSDYASRGLSQTRGDPAVQVGAYRQLGAGWSLGAGASSVDLGDWIDAKYELTASLTHTWTLGERWSAYASYTR